MKAVALISGGLDSALAAKLIKDEGIEIIGLNFKTPFCLCDKRGSSGCLNRAQQIAHNLGIELKVVGITNEFFRIIENPKHGYGSNMNPCIDCRILKFSKAREFMQVVGASFIITGEVLGQRPMSQHRQALKVIDKESQLEGLVLRPLSAKLLPKTIPEEKGWVVRDRLLDFSGRTRKPQIELAKRLKIKDYSCPAGGCLLTDPSFCRRLKDLIYHEGLNLNHVELLKLGRHFRLTPKTKLVVGRNRDENLRLVELRQENDALFMPLKISGPTALTRGPLNRDLVKLSASIVSRYCDLNDRREVEIVFKNSLNKEEILSVLPIEESHLVTLRI
ncbi:MAG: 7-cyano-7-deazaguanine synthase [Candidatus Omnitrophica bacterium]|nr:7-cyano-7-deazaguanine synthase [Candidatus Omnitrophota bacterium]